MTIPSRLPGVTYAQLPVTATVAASLSLPPRLVVLHDTSNSASAAAEARYAATRSLDGATSAHFYVDTAGPLGSLPLTKQAWAAYSYANAHGWHLEMCGYNAGMTGAVPAATIAHSARLVRALCDLGGIPMVKLAPADVAAGKRGICGHRDITLGLGVGTHDDPGPSFDWPAFIAAVRGDDVSKAEVIDALDDKVPYTSQGVGDWAVAHGWDPAGVSTRALLEYVWQRTYYDVPQLAKDVAELKARPPAAVDPAQLQTAVQTAVGALVDQIASAVAATLGDLEAAADRARADVLDG